MAIGCVIVEGSKVYRTERGTIFRISEDREGHLAVTILDASEGWVPAPIGMAGLRLASTTARLTAREIRALP